MSPSHREAIYELPSPGPGISSVRLIRFLGSLLPRWYRLFLLLSGLLILVPFALIEQDDRTIFIFLGCSAPLLLAVMMSPLVRVRYAHDVVRRAAVTDGRLLIETFANDIQFELTEIQLVDIDDIDASGIKRWSIRSADPTQRYRIWAPHDLPSLRNQYDNLVVVLTDHLPGHIQDKKKA